MDWWNVKILLVICTKNRIETNPIRQKRCLGNGKINIAFGEDN